MHSDGACVTSGKVNLNFGCSWKVPQPAPPGMGSHMGPPTGWLLCKNTSGQSSRRKNWTEPVTPMLSITSLLCICTSIPPAFTFCFKKIVDIHSQLPLNLLWPAHVCTTLASALNNEANISSVKIQMNTLQTGKMEAECLALQNIQRTGNCNSVLRDLLSLPSSGPLGFTSAASLTPYLKNWCHLWRTSKAQQTGKYPAPLQSVGVRWAGAQISNALAVSGAMRLHAAPQDQHGRLRSVSWWMWRSYLSGTTRSVWLEMQHEDCMGPCPLPQDSNWRGGDGTPVNLIVHRIT